MHYFYILKRVNLKIIGSLIKDDSRKKPIKHVKHFQVKPNAQKTECVIIELHSQNELL